MINYTYIAKSGVDPTGYGAFAAAARSFGELVEECPVIPVRFDTDDPSLGNYRFGWTDDMDCIAIGNLMAYNHSDDPNVELVRDFDAKIIFVRALRDIAAGEELFFSYGCGPWW